MFKPRPYEPLLAIMGFGILVVVALAAGLRFTFPEWHAAVPVMLAASITVAVVVVDLVFLAFVK